MESRSKNTIRNAAIALAMQIVSVVLSFIGRTVFALLLEKGIFGIRRIILKYYFCTISIGAWNRQCDYRKFI